MSLQRARSAEEYVEWIKQAAFEVDDLRDCYDFQMDELGRYPGFLEPLEQGIKSLYQSMVEGEYHFDREDLPFMGLVNRHDDEIPFAILLRQINETHRKGIDVDVD
ncbi:MAG: general secretion pathway protein GspF [Candidatus Thiodiazotropha sp. (ex Lucinoma annulata)]|nr:general secretion pathway protein GspF [Candidatus Thiodiazotropha sp. (ex Lucinoma borealis)]MCU7839848.1 general secretion pathway protein GspF [Candidatus Thiodiazotropha sp. (ex Troendleina suluensis)]MCU7855761.1 general secretion pathway protein GspF [Candidatus Thiodiazotropha sp. (ex Lucinoma borealis)]MCU7868260.1 general secretion pathway protein GspF [Candidatus Thiodiazotropha sp. (ex Lucinoma borealis)]MCU7882806.1 general secretion pathway protein GspF [Candidatus Thiodiazotrop